MKSLPFSADADQSRWTVLYGPPPTVWPEHMSFTRQNIDTFGKPYHHVGWHDNGNPKFVKKQRQVRINELATVGLEPVFDEDGWFVGTTKKVEEVAIPPESTQIPDHMLDAERFTKEILEAPYFVTPFFQSGRQHGKTATFKPFGNPCAEIPLGGEPGILPPRDDTEFERKHPMSKELQTLFGHKLYNGPAVDVTVWNDDASMGCEVTIKQHRVMTERVIKFGPLQTNLTALLGMGYWLETKLEYKHFNPHAERWARVYLSDGVDRYRLYRIGWHELQAMGKIHGQYDLGSAITNGMNLLRTHSSARYPKPVIQERIVEKVIERDPFEILAERYPQRGKRKLTMDTMVGNRTLGERLADHF